MPRPAHLKAREKAFCRHYLVEGSATAAAIKAGYSSRGANVAGARLLKRKIVRDEIARLREAQGQTVNKVLTRALDGSDATPDGKMSAVPEELRAEVEAEVQARLTRAYLDAALYENLEIALGRRPATITKVSTSKKKDAKGNPLPPSTLELRVYMRDAAAANQAIKILYETTIAYKEKTSHDGELGKATPIDPGLRAVLMKFREVAGLPPPTIDVTPVQPEKIKPAPKPRPRPSAPPPRPRGKKGK